MYFHYFLLSPLEKGRGLESPSPKDAFSQVWLFWPSGPGKEDENVESLRQQQQQQRGTLDKF